MEGSHEPSRAAPSTLAPRQPIAPRSGERHFHGPADQFPLADADWDRIRACIDAVVALRSGRAEWLHTTGQDPTLHLPGHMWNDPFVDAQFAHLARKDRHTIEHLRCLTYNFTGFSLLSMGPCGDRPDLLAVPADVDAIVRGNSERAGAIADGFVGITRGLPVDRLVDVPRLFGESGVAVDGRITNCDSWSTQQRLNGLHHAGVIDLLRARARARGAVRIVEIGAGYGSLAHALHRLCGAVDYTIVDLPESLIYSTIYLSTTLPEVPHTVLQAGQPLPPRRPGVTYVGNHLLPSLLSEFGEIDLAVNVMSLSEMSPAQVAHYGTAARTLLGSSGVFYEQNYVEAGVQTDVIAILRRIFGYGAELLETPNPHRGRGPARLWSNRYLGALCNRGGLRPIATEAGPAPDQQRP